MLGEEIMIPLKQTITALEGDYMGPMVTVISPPFTQPGVTTPQVYRSIFVSLGTTTLLIPVDARWYIIFPDSQTFFQLNTANFRTGTLNIASIEKGEDIFFPLSNFVAAFNIEYNIADDGVVTISY